jgi:hypothetical protein
VAVQEEQERVTYRSIFGEPEFRANMTGAATCHAGGLRLHQREGRGTGRSPDTPGHNNVMPLSPDRWWNRGPEL